MKDTPDIPPAPDSPESSFVYSGTSKAAEQITYLPLETGKFLLNTAGAARDGFIKAIHNEFYPNDPDAPMNVKTKRVMELYEVAFNASKKTAVDAATEVKQRLLAVVKQVRNAPLVFSKMVGPENLRQRKFEYLQAMSETPEWYQLFVEKPQVITSDSIADVTLKKGGSDPLYSALSYLKYHESKADRETLFKTFIENHLPENYLSLPYNGDAADHPFAALQQTAPLTNEQVQRMAAIVGGTQGAVDLTGHDAEYAQQLVLEFYEPADGTMPARNIVNDFRQAEKQLTLAPGSTHLSAASFDGVSPSLLKGAVKLGLLTPQRMQELMESNIDVELAKKGQILQTKAQLEALTGQTNAELKQESDDIFKYWKKVPTLAKIAVIAAGLIAVWKTKVGKYAAGTALGVYVWHKMFDLHKQADWLKDKTKKLTGAAIDKVGLEEINALSEKRVNDADLKKAELSMQFLSEYDQENLVTEATGLALLTSLPLNELAEHFAASEGNVADGWYLDIRAGSPLRKQLKLQAAAQGWNPRFESFFDNASNVAEVSDALSYVFLRKAASEPRLQTKFARLEKAVGPMASGLTYHDVYQKGGLEVARDYAELVEYGRNLALSDGTPLAKFMTDEIKKIES